MITIHTPVSKSLAFNIINARQSLAFSSDEAGRFAKQCLTYAQLGFELCSP